ncbi:MAG: DUF1786 domain-containing protein [Methanobacteriaceae archaeon]|jgi:uncharacterized protein (DUF1786 family)|nr:DUF1786 domain-containing protein [Methanobacteriaceae archaeon]
MKILAVDVGQGTQDILLYDSNKNIENSIKLVLPSPTRIFSSKINKLNKDLFISGETMGGGPINKAIENHLIKGYQVVMEEKAARTIRDDLKKVKKLGIEIVSENNNNNNNFTDFAKIDLKDVDLRAIGMALSFFDVKLEFDYVGVAVQDHGYNQMMGDRNFRFLKIREKLNEPIAPEEFSYRGNVPDYFTRMKAVSRTLSEFELFLMDSKFASVCGATKDSQVENLDSYVVIDIGNGHTLAASIENGKIKGIFEHHTGSITPEKIEIYIKKLADATITHDEIHDDHGHGAWVLEPITKIEKILVTGPRRELMDKVPLPVYNATPAGDVMMTGPVGLINCIKHHIIK